MTKNKHKFHTIQDVYDAAGGSTQLAARLNIHAYTVENWRRSGVPIKYWSDVMEFYKITPSELYHISQGCLASRNLKSSN